MQVPTAIEYIAYSFIAVFSIAALILVLMTFSVTFGDRRLKQNTHIRTVDLSKTDQVTNSEILNQIQSFIYDEGQGDGMNNVVYRVYSGSGLVKDYRIENNNTYVKSPYFSTRVGSF